jgi:hypothetical protein
MDYLIMTNNLFSQFYIFLFINNILAKRARHFSIESKKVKMHNEMAELLQQITMDNNN